MTTKEQAIQAWQSVLNSKETVGKYRSAFVGDGGGTIDVDGEPGFIWVRYSADQSKVSKVFSVIRGLQEDYPIKVGRMYPDDEFEQVLGMDWVQYQDTVTDATISNYSTPNHGDSHNAASGVDPAPVDLRNIIEMRGREQTTPDLTVHVESGRYVYGYNDARQFNGGNLDLTASVPGGAGHMYSLVYLDAVARSLDNSDSATVPLFANPVVPAVEANTIPICVVDLENGQTTITENDIFDYRFLWNLISWNAAWLVGTNAERLALVVGDLAELTHFAETDTDQVWQVWEGAWRIVYPPAALAASDGTPGTPWLVGATGVLTGSQNLELDDGVAASPKLIFIDGDDTQVELWYDSTGNNFHLVIPAASTFVINEDGLDVDVRMEGASISNLFLLDAGNDQIETHGGRIVSTTRVDDGDSPYTTLNTDRVLFCDTDGGAITVNLQAGVEGRYFRIINVGTSGNDVTIDGNGAETVMGALTQTLSDGEIMILVYNATEGWW